MALFRLEAMAHVAREVGDWDLAESMARQMLEHDAAYGGSHERPRATGEMPIPAFRSWRWSPVFGRRGHTSLQVAGRPFLYPPYRLLG